MNEQSALQSIGESAVGAASETVGKTTSLVMDLIHKHFTFDNFFKIIGILVVLILIRFIFKAIRIGINKVLYSKEEISKLKGKKEQVKKNEVRDLVVNKFVSYGYYVVSILYLASAFGIKLSAIWGAAGIAGIAIGFAAQTSVSNLISGIFLMCEKTIKIGDFINVAGVAGTVDSIGLLSVKIHNLDNQLIRIPNSSIINSNFQNNSFNSVRRMNFETSIAYESDMRKALEALKKVPELCPSVLKDKNHEPAVWYSSFGDSGINMVLAVWFKPADLATTRNEVFIAIMDVFKDAGIEIPYTHIDVNIVK